MKERTRRRWTRWPSNWWMNFAGRLPAPRKDRLGGAAGSAGGCRVIVALGIECVDSERFARALERHGARLLERLFTDAEQRAGGAGRRRSERLAARFAAKVAARRALFGSPLAGATRWRDFEVTREPSGRPSLRFHGVAQRQADALGIARVHLTLAHDAPVCVGHVLFESSGG